MVGDATPMSSAKDAALRRCSSWPSVLSRSCPQKSEASPNSPVMGSKSSRMSAFEATKAQAEAEGTWSFRTASRSPERRWQPRPLTAFELTHLQAVQAGTCSFRTASRSPSPKATRLQRAVGYFWRGWSQPQPQSQADLPGTPDNEVYGTASEPSENLASAADNLQCLQQELEHLRMQNQSLKSSEPSLSTAKDLQCLQEEFCQLRMQNETLKILAEQVPLQLDLFEGPATDVFVEDPMLVEQDPPQAQGFRGDKECDWPSQGSRNHPHACAQPCKFFYSAKGCKDGNKCNRCHMCPWTAAAGKTKAKKPSWKSQAEDICLPIGQVR